MLSTPTHHEKKPVVS